LRLPRRCSRYIWLLWYHTISLITIIDKCWGKNQYFSWCVDLEQ
jgi:hypothetical protein